MISSLLRINGSCFSSFLSTHHITKPLKHNLITIFNEQSSKKQLSLTLKILPFYFTNELIESFSKTDKYAQYMEYVTLPGESLTDTSYLYKFVSTPELTKLVNNRLMRRYLQAYVHWLMKECESFDQLYNNYFIEHLNLERPDKWFQIKSYCPQRTFIYHHGPTNSGKSTSAVEELKNLKHDQNGIYMAPLRLLAWQYQQKLGNCSLVTGQEKDYRNSNLISCTIEAAPLIDEYEVAVIDQIQMIGNTERGWAWTKAIIGLKAKRIHLCGDQRALDIITKLIKMTGDILEERKYSRLSKLILVHKNFKLESISQGDCVINFSMKSLIEHRNDINKMIVASREQKRKQQEEGQKIEGDQLPQMIKNNHAAIIYGKLPPECRKDQAKLFNEKKLPYLVATNAIGMGLNLNIKKIVFMAIHRTNVQGSKEQLQDHEIQQIAGRAGRGKQTGYVQCLNGYILSRVKKALSHVNLSYGLNLQNLAENESEKIQIVNEPKFEDRISETSKNYNIFLKRHLKQKQCNIQKAGYYYNLDFIAKIKMMIQDSFGVKMQLNEMLSFLKNYAILGNEYFLQQDFYPDYLIKILEDKCFHSVDMFMFLAGLSLSETPGSAKPDMKAIVKFYHKEYINSFIAQRRVRVPELIVEYDRENFSKFIYMDQIMELQYYFNLLQSYVWLWSKYQFQFYEVGLARQIKLRLAHKINQVLQNNQFLPRQKKAEGQRKNSSKRAPEQYVRSKRFRQRNVSWIKKYQRLETYIQSQQMPEISKQDCIKSPEIKHRLQLKTNMQTIQDQELNNQDLSKKQKIIEKGKKLKSEEGSQKHFLTKKYRKYIQRSLKGFSLLFNNKVLSSQRKLK